MKTISHTGIGSRGLLAGLAAGALLGGGCTFIPDSCQGYPQACLAVTVEHGPSDIYQLLVAVLEGYGSTSPITPRRKPDQPLTYPLRFGIRFAEFDALHKGTIRFSVEAINQTNDSIGYLEQTVSISGYEHEQVTVTLGPPADMAATDLAVAHDMAVPAAGDMH